jgi:hypothetical protein
MPVSELNFRKKQLVQELNGFIGLKKAYGAQAATRSELLAGAPSASGPSEQQLAGELGALVPACSGPPPAPTTAPLFTPL